MIRNIVIIIFLLFVTSCNSILKVENRVKFAQELVKESDFNKENIKTDDFYLFSYQRITNISNKTLNVYIEGDGFAWRNRYTLSRNPTPINPIALRMALEDKSDNVVYLARPCQFSDYKVDLKCNNEEFWSRARFSNEVVNSTSQAIDVLKKKYNAKEINLFGFSGGGAIAILVAAKRNDVKSIKTIAANLDHVELMKIHSATPLSKSLNPIDFAKEVANINQTHLAGELDKIIPTHIIQSFVDLVNKESKGLNKAHIKTIKEANHEYKRWPQVWSEFINK